MRTAASCVRTNRYSEEVGKGIGGERQWMTKALSLSGLKNRVCPISRLIFGDAKGKLTSRTFEFEATDHGWITQEIGGIASRQN